MMLEYAAMCLPSRRNSLKRSRANQVLFIARSTVASPLGTLSPCLSSASPLYITRPTSRSHTWAVEIRWGGRGKEEIDQRRFLALVLHPDHRRRPNATRSPSRILLWPFLTLSQCLYRKISAQGLSTSSAHGWAVHDQLRLGQLVGL